MDPVSQPAEWKCVYVPTAVCYHKRGATAKVLPHYPVKMQERNLTAIYAKNFPSDALFRKGPVIVASRIRRMYRSARTGAGRPALTGFLAGMMVLLGMLRKRREIQRLRRITVDAFLELLGTGL